MKIGIVTDSTADLPQELVREYEIEVLPLQVSFDNQSFRDGVDLTPAAFYHKLQESKSTPVTSQPAPGIFIECYQKLLQKVDAILSIHLTGKFSGTVRVAELAGEMFPGADIRVVDSRSTSMGLGCLVLEAARAARNGSTPDQVVALLHHLRERVHFLVTLDTLEFLRRGGRASKMQAFLSSILQIKPLLRMARGEVELVAKVRSRRESIQMMLDHFKTLLAADSKAVIAVMYTTAEKEALKLQTIIQETFQQAEVIINQAGPVLGTHTGPGALALIGVAKV